MQVLYPARIGIWKCRFWGENPTKQSDDHQQTQPTYGTGPESNQDHFGEEQAMPSQNLAIFARCSEKMVGVGVGGTPLYGLFKQ